MHGLVVRWWSGSYADDKILACTYFIIEIVQIHIPRI